MKTTTRARVASLVVAALAATGLAAATPGAAATPTIAYTTLEAQGGCWLGTIDLATGEVSRLSAPAAQETCVNDLAASDELVLGVYQVLDQQPPEIIDRAVDGPGSYLVSFDPATGTPTATRITVTGTAQSPFLAHGGIAIAEDGTVYAHLVSDAPGCGMSAVCVVTLDPATAVATPIGLTGLAETTIYELAACGDSLAGFRRDVLNDTARLFAHRVVTIDPSTGAGTVGAAVDRPTFGFDCAEGTAHVVTGEFPRSGRAAEDYYPLQDANLGTIDLGTGTVTVGTALNTTEDLGRLALLAIPVQTTPEPTTTTTTAPGPTSTTTTRPAATAATTATAATPVSARPAYTG